MISLQGKTLLVLGGTSASLDVVRVAKAEGVRVIAADWLETGVAKDEADEAVRISTTDMEALSALIRERKIDGVFCGPSEFQLQNVMRLCELTGLPFYCTPEQWRRCADKASFKAMCRRYGVPCVPDVSVDGRFLPEDLARIPYPVMVKPADGCSSRGIAVCQNHDALKRAYARALEFSPSGRVIAERYIENQQSLAARYIAWDGEIYLLAVNERYMVDPSTCAISAFAVYPSGRTDEYIRAIDPAVRAMMKGLGLANGAFFLQALVDKSDGKIYFHEMGLRLSGGLNYKIIEPITGINDLKMMLRHALGQPLSSPEEIQNIDPFLRGKVSGSLCVPLKPGTVGGVAGLDRIMEAFPGITLAQYYRPGDTVKPESFGTLDQHFGRFKFIADSREGLFETARFINETLEIADEGGNDMIYARFDLNRAKFN